MQALGALDAERDLQPGSEVLAGVLAGLQDCGIALSEQLSLRFFSHSMLRQTFAT